MLAVASMPRRGDLAHSPNGRSILADSDRKWPLHCNAVEYQAQDIEIRETFAGAPRGCEKAGSRGWLLPRQQASIRGNSDFELSSGIKGLILYCCMTRRLIAPTGEHDMKTTNLMWESSSDLSSISISGPRHKRGVQ
jgi:hypothetical protein